LRRTGESTEPDGFGSGGAAVLKTWADPRSRSACIPASTLSRSYGRPETAAPSARVLTIAAVARTAVVGAERRRLHRASRTTPATAQVPITAIPSVWTAESSVPNRAL